MPTEPQILPLSGVNVGVNFLDDESVTVMIRLIDNSVSFASM